MTVCKPGQLAAGGTGPRPGPRAAVLQDLEGYQRPDVAVFADTKAEPPHVYETLGWLEARVDFPILRRSAGDLWRDTWRGLLAIGVETKRRPAGVQNFDLPVFGSDDGLAPRRCTRDYKIDVIKRTIRQFAEADPPHLQVLQYVGISKDESYRIKPSRERYITIDYPLAQEGWTREDCIKWMNLRYPNAPVGRSSCFFCPYHSLDEWRFIRHFYPDLYNEALALEQAFNNVPVGPFSLSRPPGLVQAMAARDMQGEFPLDTDGRDHFGNECEGMCGV